jgi:hypothetical protein
MLMDDKLAAMLNHRGACQTKREFNGFSAQGQRMTQ